VNCNSSKGNTPISPPDYFWPDVDNTLRAFEYVRGGMVRPHPSLAPGLASKAQATIGLTGLDRDPGNPGRVPTSADKRWLRRQQAWEKAEHCRDILATGYRTGHRHLLVGAYLVYTVYGWGEELSRLPLHTSLAIESTFHHEIATRQSFITNRGIMEALHILYYDDAQNKPKRGPIMNKNAPGSLYRFIDVVQQLDVTYDLYSMSGAEIVSHLPVEFSHWIEAQMKIPRQAGA